MGVDVVEIGQASLTQIGNSLTPLMLNTEMLVEQAKSDEVGQSAHAIFKAARRIAFALRRLRRVQDPQMVAYVGQYGRSVPCQSGYARSIGRARSTRAGSVPPRVAVSPNPQ